MRRNAASTTRRVGRYFALGNTCPVQLFLVIVVVVLIIFPPPLFFTGRKRRPLGIGIEAPAWAYRLDYSSKLVTRIISLWSSHLGATIGNPVQGEHPQNSGGIFTDSRAQLINCSRVLYKLIPNTKRKHRERNCLHVSAIKETAKLTIRFSKVQSRIGLSQIPAKRCLA